MTLSVNVNWKKNCQSPGLISKYGYKKWLANLTQARHIESGFISLQDDTNQHQHGSLMAQQKNNRNMQQADQISVSQHKLKPAVSNAIVPTDAMSTIYSTRSNSDSLTSNPTVDGSNLRSEAANISFNSVLYLRNMPGSNHGSIHNDSADPNNTSIHFPFELHDISGHSLAMGTQDQKNGSLSFDSRRHVLSVAKFLDNKLRPEESKIEPNTTMQGLVKPPVDEALQMNERNIHVLDLELQIAELDDIFGKEESEGEQEKDDTCLLEFNKGHARRKIWSNSLLIKLAKVGLKAHRLGARIKPSHQLLDLEKEKL
ncbi:hypothetical protein V1514DRAFT_318112 [Lipomyces japonicus]|uniref:uncharacterized protein n=1 Tax=Lipomyces japonicus TaxID=56871 RepID=UPI0034CFD4F6